MKRLPAETAAELDALLPALFDRAFSGKLVPQHHNDEPASALLERIKSRKDGRE